MRLFTVGHSSHDPATFVGLLRAHGVDALADVRSVPYSRRHPQFRRDALAATLKTAGVAYVFLGAELGGKGVWDPASAAFQAGLDRVRDGMTRHTVALMCAEKDPLTCHRFGLICRALRGEVAIVHILADGSLESQADAEARLMAEEGVAPLPLVDDDPLAAALRKRFG